MVAEIDQFDQYRHLLDVVLVLENTLDIDGVQVVQV
jgi:hypothetical protein